MPQAERTGTHGRNQIRVGIKDDHLDRARQFAHEALAKDVAGAHGKSPIKNL